MQRIIAVIPTYNEAENLPLLVPRILEQDPRLEVLVVDDASPDGTGKLADDLALANGRVHVLHRSQKQGLGPAYRAGLRRALDLGADGVMVPMVESAAQAEAAARACRYGPEGSRSFGMQTSRVDPFASDYRPLCAIQIETTGALADLEAIAAVDGVDWLYIGPADLGLSVGGVPAADVVSVFDGSHPLAARLTSAFSTLVETARARGKLPGLHCGSGEAAALAMSHGFAVACVTSDLISVQTGMEEQLRLARAIG
jgi:4-hydroxy-2-oxoheptanedioate aldolase